MMNRIRTRMPKIAPALALLAVSAACTRMPAQMHKVEAPDTVTRAVGVYEYVGDPLHPRAARLIPVSLFIGGHFEDAGVYLARPIPFALNSGLRYELQHAGVMQNYLDVIASRNFAGSSVAATQPFEDGWFGYGRVSPPAPPKSARQRPNCTTAHVVQEVDNSKQDDAKPHFGTKPADSKPADTTAPATTRRRGQPAPDPCHDGDDKAEKISLTDDTPKDKNTPDPERPTLHRSPETTANNIGANGKDTKQDKKAPKPPAAVVTANGGPADDPDRPHIRHRDTDENDPNNLPPDPIDLKVADAAKAEKAATAATPDTTKSASAKSNPVASTGNNTVTEDATVDSGDTMNGGPHLQRGHISAPPPDAKSAAVHSTTTTAATATAITSVSKPAAASALPAPLDTLVAVSDAKDRTAHDFTYKFASSTEHAAAVSALEGMAQAVLANPALATDATDGVKAAAAAAAAKPSPAKPAATTHPSATHTATTTHNTATTAAARAKAAKAKAAAPAVPVLADEEITAYQLYYSAPVTYVMTARVAATDAAPERFITVVATTDAEGRLQPAMRSITDAMHLDRTPRYRLIDAVDADGTNRASLLMELRSQHSRQFALYRLLGNKPDQIFITGSTLL